MYARRLLSYVPWTFYYYIVIIVLRQGLFRLSTLGLNLLCSPVHLNLVFFCFSLWNNWDDRLGPSLPQTDHLDVESAVSVPILP